MSPRVIVFVLALVCISSAPRAAPVIVIWSFYSGENEYNDHSNDSPTSADLLLGGGVNPPSYFVPTDVDYYRLNVSNVPSTLTAHVDGVSGVVISGDPEVWLESSTGTILAHHDDLVPGVNLNCFVQFVFSTPGAYFVRVQHSSKSPWYYDYSNYYLWGEYRFPRPLVAVRHSRWSLYR